MKTATKRTREYLVVYGPPGSGKSLNASAICEVLGYDHIIDADFARLHSPPLAGKIILLSHTEKVRDPDHTGRPYRYVLRKKPIEAVKKLLGARWIEKPSTARTWAATSPEDKGVYIELAADFAVEPVIKEVARATAKFPSWPTDPLHAVAVLGEEFGELTKEVLQLTYEPHKSSPEAVRKEAVQCAAMALRFLMSLDAYVYARGIQHQQEIPAP